MQANALSLGKIFFIFNSKNKTLVHYKDLQSKLSTPRQAQHKKLGGCSFNVNNLSPTKEQCEMKKACTWCVTNFIHTKHSCCEIQQNCYKRNGVADYGWN